MKFLLSNLLILLLASLTQGEGVTTTTTTTTNLRQQSQKQESHRDLGANPNVDIEFCSSDKDCGSDSYCGGGECFEMGSCETDEDCRNPANMYPVIECTGPLLCFEDSKTCGRICGPECEDGSFPLETNCGGLVPCDITDDICFSSAEVVSCQNDYCGGACNAFVFDAAGYHELCIGPLISSTKSCNSSADCIESQYCQQGICMDDGECSTDADCFNPDNQYITIACVGPISCRGGGCGITCADSFCPVKEEISEDCSPASCDIMSEVCEDSYASCVDYVCGTCGAFVFDDAGNTVCDALRSINDTTTCTSIADCGESQYCQQGVCMEGGECTIDADCFNPENVYAQILCVGPITCEAGLCSKTCSESTCPVNDTVPVAECSPVSCDVMESACDDSYINCVDYGCGDCASFVFDEAGYTVCESAALVGPSRCTSTSDCNGTQYCQQGMCVDEGKCLSDADCFNPENMYITIACVGPITCEDGACSKSCSDSNCPAEDIIPVDECSPVSCDVMKEACTDDFTNCVAYGCGSCGSFVFDEAGYSVCQSANFTNATAY